MERLEEHGKREFTQNLTCNCWMMCSVSLQSVSVYKHITCDRLFIQIGCFILKKYQKIGSWQSHYTGIAVRIFLHAHDKVMWCVCVLSCGVDQTRIISVDTLLLVSCTSLIV